MASDREIIYALQCSMRAKSPCIGDACPYFRGAKECSRAAKEDAILRMQQIQRLQQRLNKEGWQG